MVIKRSFYGQSLTRGGLVQSLGKEIACSFVLRVIIPLFLQLHFVQWRAIRTQLGESWTFVLLDSEFSGQLIPRLYMEWLRKINHLIWVKPESFNFIRNMLTSAVCNNKPACGSANVSLERNVGRAKIPSCAFISTFDLRWVVTACRVRLIIWISSTSIEVIPHLASSVKAANANRDHENQEHFSLRVIVFFCLFVFITPLCFTFPCKIRTLLWLKGDFITSHSSA